MHHQIVQTRLVLEFWPARRSQGVPVRIRDNFRQRLCVGGGGGVGVGVGVSGVKLFLVNAIKATFLILGLCNLDIGCI